MAGPVPAINVFDSARRRQSRLNFPLS